MFYAVSSVATVAMFVLALGFFGWFAVAPFAGTVPRPVLVAPMAGLLIWPALTLLIYVALQWRWPLAASAAGSICLLLSAADLAWRRPRLPRLSFGLISLTALVTALVVAAVLLNQAPSLRLGEAALVFKDGTDQAGYAQVADWLRQHGIADHPRMDSARPYESWPAMMFQSDARFGSYAIVALVSLATRLPGLFAYDSACSVILIASCLAMSGLFARTGRMLGLLLIGLIISQWFDLGRTGYLGKLAGYPAALFVSGLMMWLPSVPASRRQVATATLLVLAMAAAVTYPGIVIAFMVAFVAGIFLLARAILQRQGLAALWGRDLLALAVLVVASAMASGLVARPLSPGYPETASAWSAVYAAVSGLVRDGDPLADFPGGLGVPAGMALALAWGGSLFLAVRTRQAMAAALLLPPVAILATLFLGDNRHAAAQLIGFVAPAVLIGAILASDKGLPTRQPYLALGLAAAIIVLQLPRFAATVHGADGADVPPISLISRAEMNGLLERIGTHTVLVDVATPVQLPIALLVLAGPRPNIHWTPSAWRSIAGYRHWPPPIYPDAADYRLLRADVPVPAEAVLMRTRQFQLVAAGAAWPGAWRFPRAIAGPAVDPSIPPQTQGLWPDGWMASVMAADLDGGGPDTLHLRLQIPLIDDAAFATELKIVVNGVAIHRTRLVPGDTKLDLPLPPCPTARRVELLFSAAQRLRAPDDRMVGGLLQELALTGPGG